MAHYILPQYFLFKKQNFFSIFAVTGSKGTHAMVASGFWTLDLATFKYFLSLCLSSKNKTVLLSIWTLASINTFTSFFVFASRLITYHIFHQNTFIEGRQKPFSSRLSSMMERHFHSVYTWVQMIEMMNVASSNKFCVYIIS